MQWCSASDLCTCALGIFGRRVEMDRGERLVFATIESDDAESIVIEAGEGSSG